MRRRSSPSSSPQSGTTAFSLTTGSVGTRATSAISYHDHEVYPADPGPTAGALGRGGTTINVKKVKVQGLAPRELEDRGPAVRGPPVRQPAVRYPAVRYPAVPVSGGSGSGRPTTGASVSGGSIPSGSVTGGSLSGVSGPPAGVNGWRLSAFYPSISAGATHIVCPSTTDCYVIGIYGAMYDTKNGGNSWNNETAPSPVFELADISCPSTTTCYVLEFQSQTGPEALIATTDGGISWTIKTDVHRNFIIGALPESTTLCFMPF